MPRYIDADKVIDKINDKRVLLGCKGAYVNGLQYAIHCIETTSREDVAPVVHAHWIIKKDPVFGEVVRYTCSHCGEHWSPIAVDREMLNSWYYCPNCGAIMDEESEEYDADKSR